MCCHALTFIWQHLGRGSEDGGEIADLFCRLNSLPAYVVSTQIWSHGMCATEKNRNPLNLKTIIGSLLIA